MKNDEWCDFCNDKMKSIIVTRGSREYHICNHCASLMVIEREIKEDTTNERQ